MFIIHQAKKIDREALVYDLIKKYPDYKIIEPLSPPDLSIYGGRRKNIKYITAELSLSLTNLKIMEEIISSKLNNVLIMEDDAIQVNPIPEDLDQNAYCIYLHNLIHPGKTSTQIYDCQAMYYPKWENTQKLYDLIKAQPKLLAWDNELQMIKEKYNLYDRMFQTKDLIFKQAVGQSTIVTNYFNDRYK